MEKKRDWVAVLLEAVCWIALMGAEFFFLLSFLPWKFLWIFPILTLLILAFALARRKLSKRKVFIRITGIILAASMLVTGWVCFSDAFQAIENLWWTEDLSHYERLRGGLFPSEENKQDIFPYTIPEYASEIKFHYNPQILQGGRVFSLEFRAPQEEVNNWEATFKEKADYPGSYLDQGFTSTNMAVLLSYPCEYNVYIIYAKNQSEDENPPLDHFPWNHGEICLGAVNPTTNHVYFYESNW